MASEATTTRVLAPRISVIATFYNVAECVDDCVSSILSQTYPSFEVLLVDDGSTDETLEVLRHFSADSRVRVLKKSNGGAGDARNYGVEFANGELVTFIDGDDYVSPRYLEVLVKAFDRSKCGMAVAKHVVTRVNRQELQFCHILNSSPQYLSQFEAIYSLLYNQIDEAPWAKLAPIELYKRNPFPVGRSYEDVAVSSAHYLDAGIVGVVDEAVYAYRMRSGSVVHKKHPRLSQSEDFLWAINSFISPIVDEFPQLSQACAFRLSLEYARLHTLLVNTADNGIRVSELRAFVVGELRELIDIVACDDHVLLADKLRLHLLAKTPKLYDAVFKAYEFLVKGARG